MSIKNSIIKEACVETIQEAITAEKNGADRIELCVELKHGGLTPPVDLIESAQEFLTIPLKVLIRPRKGDFIYNENELAIMETDIEICKHLDVDEIVIGVLNADRNIDYPTIVRLSKKAYPMDITFHKAIDHTPDIISEVSKLSPIEAIKGILTSGGEKTALLGKEKLKSLVSRYSHRFSIIAAGSITNNNLTKLHQYIKGNEYHGKKIVGNLN